MAADKIGDKDAVVRYAQYALKDKENDQFATQLLTDAYKAKGDTVKWIERLQEGIVKFPESRYFFANLVDHYGSSNQNDKTMRFVNDILAKDPNNELYLYVKTYLYHNTKNYEKAIEFYKKILGIDPTYAEVCSNLGLAYLLQTQDCTDKAPTDINYPDYAATRANIERSYEGIKPYYEEARKLKPDQKDLWLQGLYRVYYNLNIGPEFEAIEKLMD